MTSDEFKMYLDTVIQMAFKEGIIYERNRVKLNDNIITMEEAIKNAQRNILGE